MASGLVMLFSIPSRSVPPSALAKATVYSLKRDESFFLWFSWEEVEGKRLKSSCCVSRAWAGMVVLIWVRVFRIWRVFMFAYRINYLLNFWSVRCLSYNK